MIQLSFSDKVSFQQLILDYKDRLSQAQINQLQIFKFFRKFENRILCAILFASIESFLRKNDHENFKPYLRSIKAILKGIVNVNSLNSAQKFQQNMELVKNFIDQLIKTFKTQDDLDKNLQFLYQNRPSELIFAIEDFIQTIINSQRQRENKTVEKQNQQINYLINNLDGINKIFCVNIQIIDENKNDIIKPVQKQHEQHQSITFIYVDGRIFMCIDENKLSPQERKELENIQQIPSPLKQNSNNSQNQNSQINNKIEESNQKNPQNFLLNQIKLQPGYYSQVRNEPLDISLNLEVNEFNMNYNATCAICLTEFNTGVNLIPITICDQHKVCIGCDFKINITGGISTTSCELCEQLLQQ